MIMAVVVTTTPVVVGCVVVGGVVVAGITVKIARSSNMSSPTYALQITILPLSIDMVVSLILNVFDKMIVLNTGVAGVVYQSLVESCVGNEHLKSAACPSKTVRDFGYITGYPGITCKGPITQDCEVAPAE